MVKDQYKDQHNDTTLRWKAKYPFNFTHSEKDFYHVYTKIEAIVFLRKYLNSKQKNCEIKDYAPCLDNISSDFTIDNMKKKQD